MHSPLRRQTVRLIALGALIVFAAPVVAGLVDFPQKLIAQVAQRWGAEAPKRLTVWQKLVRDTKSSVAAGSGDALGLRRANNFFNQVPYVNDIKAWGVDDYWATPIEFLGNFQGDCEDYSVAKYLSLKELGVPVEKLRITYVRATNIGESHMVLAYYPTPDADPLILDNLIGEIKPASERPDLEPVYSFNDDDLWMPGAATRTGGANQVRLWRELLEKLAKEQRM